MFALVALLCFYSGGSNIRKGFALAGQTGWTGFSVAMVALGLVLLVVGVLCVKQAMKEYDEKKKDEAEKEKEEKEKRRRQFYYDEEITPVEEPASDANADTDIDRDE